MDLDQVRVGNHTHTHRKAIHFHIANTLKSPNTQPYTHTREHHQAFRTSTRGKGYKLVNNPEVKSLIHGVDCLHSHGQTRLEHQLVRDNEGHLGLKCLTALTKGKPSGQYEQQNLHFFKKKF